MTRCPNEDTLILYADDALERDELAVVHAHLDRCTDCRDAVDAFEDLDALLAEPETLPDGVHERLQAIPDAYPHHRVGRVTALVAAAAVVIAALAYALDFGASDEPVRPVDLVAEDVADPTDAVRAALLADDELGSRSLPRLLALALDDDVDVARLAIARLGTLERREALTGLVAALDLADRRTAAIDALGRLGHEGAVSAVARHLGDADVGDAALAAVIRIGGRESARALDAQIAATDGEADVFVDALAQVDGDVGAAALARWSRDDRTSEAALRAARTHATQLVPHLVAVARGHDDAAARDALALLEHLTPSEAVAGLRPLLNHRERRAATSRVLARIDTPESATILFAASRHDDVRAAFQRAGPTTEAWLREQLATGSRETRRDAVDLLARCGGPASMPDLVALATDRALAPVVIAAIGRIGGPDAVNALDGLASERQLLSHVVDALGATGAHGAVDVLERIGAAERAQRAPAIEALSRIPHADAVEAILRLDTGRRLKSRTTRALLVMDRDVVTTTLTSLLDSEHAPRARFALDAVRRADRSAP